MKDSLRILKNEDYTFLSPDSRKIPKEQISSASAILQATQKGLHKKGPFFVNTQNLSIMRLTILQNWFMAKKIFKLKQDL